MKIAITFTATSDHPTALYLLNIAVLLRRLKIDPESLSWTAAEGAGAWLWMIVIQDERRIAELVSEIEATDGVRKVTRLPIDPSLANTTGVRSNLPVFTEESPIAMD